MKMLNMPTYYDINFFEMHEISKCPNLLLFWITK